MTQTTDQQTPAPPASGFFGWLRSLSIRRVDGWIGGVCGGIAHRFGIDPLIVRGIAVVVAILGGPILFFYAVLWLLLPDTQGRIHLENLVHGVFEPAFFGILGIFVLNFLPIAQGVWWVGGHMPFYSWWPGVPTWPGTALHVLWNVAVAVAITWFIVWAIVRIARRPRPEWRATDAAAGAAPGAAASAADGATGTSTADAAPPSAQSSPEDIAAWRAKLQEDQRIIREQHRAELRAQQAAWAARAAADRERRRRENPRTPAWFVGIALGSALLAGGIAAAIALGAGADVMAGPVGIGTALVTVAASMIVAGLARRRSGFLTFVAIVLSVASIGSLVGRGARGHIGDAYLTAADSRFEQLVGHIGLDLDAADVPAAGKDIAIRQGAGSINLSIEKGVHAVVTITSRDSNVTTYALTGEELRPGQRFSLHAQGPGSGETETYQSTYGTGPEVRVTIDQGHGSVEIQDFSGSENQR